MITADARVLLGRAGELLTVAEREQQRAEEDVVSHLICANARQSLSHLLTAFLLQREVALDHPLTMASLLEQCKACDARFETLSLDNVHCRHEVEDRYYCIDREQVDHCLEAAQLARSIVTHSAPGY